MTCQPWPRKAGLEQQHLAAVHDNQTWSNGTQLCLLDAAQAIVHMGFHQ